MEFNRCVRCGSFFNTESSICCNCEPKDKLEGVHASSFISGNPEITSIGDLSINI
ncbi:MAG: hypothetical protein FWC79_00140 [Oscillospiraceae bacterium]|nr:hypothetical protein [Oscillospiraceae bacterium]